MKLKEKINKLPMHIKITIIHIMILLMIEIIFYPLIPFLLNYPPDSINNEFQIQVAGLKYSTQYIGLSTIIILGVTFILYKVVKKASYNALKLGQREVIRKRCMEYPYKIYLFEMLIPALIVLGALVLIRTEILLAVRIMIMFLSAGTVMAISALIASNIMYEKMLADTYNSETDVKPEGKRHGLTFSTVMQIFPIFVFSILFTSLTGYSRIIVEKGDMLFEIKKIEIQELKIKIQNKSIEDIVNTYQNREDVFLIKNDGIKILGTEDVSEFFIQYLLQKSKNYEGRVYEYYGSNVQAVSEKIIIDGNEYFIGIRYAVTSEYTILYFLVVFLIFVVFNLFASWSISHSISYDIEKVSERLKEIARQENIENTSKLPITSNNEISDLVSAFNMILDLEKQQIQQIKQSQNALIEQERLATLGQLAGGMAHDINTPLSTIIQAISYFEEFEKFENEDSERMLRVTKISAEKISKIVNSVRDQIRNIGSERITEFALKDVVKNVELLLFSELKKTNSTLEISGEDILINGDMNKLEQVVMNFIINSLQAYEELGKKNEKVMVDVSIKDDEAVITISDNAGGLPQKIADNMFKQILTTKGTKGTGFGVYFSNSIIKGVFNGRIEFDTEEGIGTTFYIILPIK